jgi:Arc/MetJ-type ribon-helix-helix transcriptional regulator
VPLTLAPETEALILNLVGEGGLTTSDDVVREALRLLEANQATALAELVRERARVGLEQAARGESWDGEKVWSEVFGGLGEE